MAKHSSPIRLENNLMMAARAAAEIHKRTPAEQIEYWAEIGKNVARLIDPETLIAFKSGLATITVEKVNAKPVGAANVFRNMEQQRSNGTLAANVTSVGKRYEASKTHPGMLDQIDENGSILTGTFNNGKFVPLEDARH
jgi:hypothetical protein